MAMVQTEEYAETLRVSDPDFGEENIKVATENMFDGTVDKVPLPLPSSLACLVSFVFFPASAMYM